jgi:predicted dehydrogenase
MRALVVGQGSIGHRHARMLAGLGCDVAVVSRRNGNEYQTYSDLGEALERENPAYVVIANETSRHKATADALAAAGFTGTVLVEKPLFDRRFPLPKSNFKKSAVAYNLRFHPIFLTLKDKLAGRQVLAVEAYVGQWLPDWRPGTDHRASYSSHAAMGGGVLRDLSHELDLIWWLFGPWSRIAALGGRRADVTVDSDDVWSVLFELESGAAATLHLNYLDRPGRRRLVVLTADTTFVADLSASTLTINGETTRFEIDRDDTYRAEHRAMIADGPGEPCTLAEGLAVLDTVAAIEHAASTRAFIVREAAA